MDGRDKARFGQSVQFGEPSPFAVELVMRRHGALVDGQYSFGLGTGTIRGKSNGDTLIFDWNWAGNTGRGVFRTTSDGAEFTGTWGYRESIDNAGTWSGRRAD